VSKLLVENFGAKVARDNLAQKRLGVSLTTCYKISSPLRTFVRLCAAPLVLFPHKLLNVRHVWRIKRQFGGQNEHIAQPIVLRLWERPAMALLRKSSDISKKEDVRVHIRTTH
jgi:hypothetical protein